MPELRWNQTNLFTMRSIAIDFRYRIRFGSQTRMQYS